MLYMSVRPVRLAIRREWDYLAADLTVSPSELGIS